MFKTLSYCTNSTHQQSRYWSHYLWLLLRSMQTCAFILFSQTPSLPHSLRKEKQLLIPKLLLLWNDLNKDLFLWSAAKSCLRKLYSQKPIRTYAQVTLQRYDSLQRETFQFDVCIMHMPVCSQVLWWEMYYFKHNGNSVMKCDILCSSE